MPAANYYLGASFRYAPHRRADMPGYFVIFVRHEDNELRKLNQAIRGSRRRTLGVYDTRRMELTSWIDSRRP